jgi:hypothetical protein
VYRLDLTPRVAGRPWADRRESGSRLPSGGRDDREDTMIDLYYWPTPNGWKISIALEEMELP